MAHIIGVIQVKGGAGRSTIATNLAGMMAASGKRVALIDGDMPQATSASWYSVRKANNKQGSLTMATAGDHTQLIAEIERLNADNDVIIIDAPPRIAEITRVALILSNLCIVPLGASLADIWATADLLATIELAKQHKPNVNVRVLWNKFRQSTKSAKDLSLEVTEQLNLKVLGTKLGYRVAYSDAFGEGLTVTEWTDKAAKDEMLMLGIELEQLLKMKSTRK
jgi:chromosome partitioning protein